MKKQMELYIHIPFCVRKCAYCDFLSFAADEKLQKDYVSALQKELIFYGQQKKDREISTIFVGGGTPSWLHEKEMAAIFDTVYQTFRVASNAEISMECNPGTVTEQKFEVYRNIGVNRLSIGLQSAKNEELKLLGRIHTFEQFLKTYDMARHYGFSNINIDLMSSLPGQSAKSFLDSLKKVVRLKPEHISAYSLIIEEGTPFYQTYYEDVLRRENGEKTNLLPSEEEEELTTRQTRAYLQAEGYHWYEISNFAKPGKECKHNIGYWKREDYLGVGIGAASLIDNVRYSNETDIYEYIRHPVGNRTGDLITRKAQMEEFMFLGLRMVDGFMRTEFIDAFGVEPEGIYGNVFNSLQNEGLLERKEGNIRLTEKGIDVSNYALAKFLITKE